MYFDIRLWHFTLGLRHRIWISVLYGLLGALCGLLRLALLGWLIAQVFIGQPILDLKFEISLIVLVMMLRGVFEYLRTLMVIPFQDIH